MVSRLPANACIGRGNTGSRMRPTDFLVLSNMRTYMCKGTNKLGGEPIGVYHHDAALMRFVRDQPLVAEMAQHS